MWDQLDFDDSKESQEKRADIQRRWVSVTDSRGGKQLYDLMTCKFYLIFPNFLIYLKPSFTSKEIRSGSRIPMMMMKKNHRLQVFIFNI